MKPYLIRTPNFNVTSGGIRVMYGLYGWLLAKGQVVYINSKIDNIETIGIYPDIYHGNDMGATTVVRYILNKPGIMATYGVPGPDTEEIKKTSDFIFVFSKIFDTFDSPSSHFMFLPILNLFLFKNQKKKRTKTCYLVGKGENKNLHPKDSILIDRKFAFNQQALADLLNECKRMYCYDPVSAQMEIARLCGCPVTMLNADRDVLRDYEPGLNGVSFKINEEVPLEAEGFRKHYKSLIGKFNEKIDLFISITQK